MWFHVEQRPFQPYLTHWRMVEPDTWTIVHHWQPERKLQRWMNVKQHDWKAGDRNELDQGRAGVLRALDHRNPAFNRGLRSVLGRGSIEDVERTAVALHSMWNR